MATATRSKVKIHPLGDRVVVKASDQSDEPEMRGGLYIPDTAKEKPSSGEVVAVGPGRFEKGERVPMELKVGQVVLYGKYSGQIYNVGGQEYVVIKEQDVYAVLG